MDILRLQYKLSKEEIEEALLCLNYRREGRFRRVNLWIISILGAVVLVMYIQNPGQFFLFLLLCAIILFLFYLMYGPESSRRRRAKKMAQMDGDYRLVITDSEIRYGDREEKIRFAGVKKKEFISSENVHTLKVDQNVFTIPRRILSEGEEDELVRIMKGHQVSVVNIRIKEGKGYGKRPAREND